MLALCIGATLACALLVFSGGSPRRGAPWPPRGGRGNTPGALIRVPKIGPKIVVVMWQRDDALMGATRACETLTTEACNANQFTLDLIRISRLFNPDAQFVLMVDAKSLAKQPYYASVLKSLRVKVVSRDAYRTSGSRALRRPTRGAACRVVRGVQIE